MAYNANLADRLGKYLHQFPKLVIVEKRMFGGLAFMVNDKMCVNVSGNKLMCRFNPNLAEELSKKKGFLPMIMKGKVYTGYCYVNPEGVQRKEDFEYWVNLCLDYNSKAKSSKK